MTTKNLKRMLVVNRRLNPAMEPSPTLTDDEVSKEKLNDGWQDGFENNLDETTFKKLAPRLEKFKSILFFGS